MDFKQIDKLYLRYGYELKTTLSTDDVRIFTLSKGVYYGADIVFEAKNEKFEEIHSHLSKAGYACREVPIAQVSDAEELLFESFFHSTQLNERLSGKYSKFAQQQTDLLKVKYEYIPVPYRVDNEEFNSNALITKNVLDKLKTKGAQLIIIEAAAGFGKTCTSYELINEICISKQKLAPIFTELSRDRKAAIFKHILNDVIINEFHSLLDEKLVIHEIQTGKIPLIIDGFDELLSKEQDKGGDDFEQVETMLSTIGDLLKENAKIILTGRKTAIFSGDSFQEWIENNPNEFSVSRYLINPPSLEDWLDEEKRTLISQNNIPIKDVANPVLLAFMRSLSLAVFTDVVRTPEEIVTRYFNSILEREQERQELRMDVDDQLQIFENLAVAMMELDITSESKEWIKFLIEEQNRELLDSVRKLYPPTQRPTMDEIANTLSDHALLDRKGNSNKIGFINDFIFGTFIGKGLIKQEDKKVEKVSTHMYELASTSFQFQSKDLKNELWNKIGGSDRFSMQEKIITEYILKDEILFNFSNGSFSDFSLSHIGFTKEGQYDSCVFSNCTFDSCFFNPIAFKNTSFVNCVFEQCELIIVEGVELNTTHLIGCEDYKSGFISSFETNEKAADVESPLRTTILSKFYKHSNHQPRIKKISFLIKEMKPEERADTAKIIESLEKNGFIKTKGDNASLTESGIQLSTIPKKN